MWACPICPKGIMAEGVDRFSLSAGAVWGRLASTSIDIGSAIGIDMVIGAGSFSILAAVTEDAATV